MLFCTRSYICSKEWRIKNELLFWVSGWSALYSKTSIHYLQDSNSKVSDKTHWYSLSCECPGHILWTAKCPQSSLDLPNFEGHLWSFEMLWVPCLCYVLRIESRVASGSRNSPQKLTDYVNPYLICSELFLMTMHMIRYILFAGYDCFIICGKWHLRSRISSVGQYLELAHSCPKAVSTS